MSKSIELSITVHATAPEIWGALTDHDELENWWSEDVQIEPRVGGIFREAWEDDDGKSQLAMGKVLVVQKNKEITFTWKEKAWPASANTQCTFRIEDKKTQRVLHILHEGWDSLPEAQRKKTMEDFTLGWKFHLKELKSYLDD